MEQNLLGNYGKEYYEEHFCENILSSDQWVRRCCLKYFLHRALVAILFGGAELFGQFRLRAVKVEFLCEVILLDAN